MPIYYNTGAPTPSTKNNITDIAVTYGIRDFLLNKNLAPVYPTAFNLSPGTVKIGEPILDTMVGTGNVTVPNGLPLETEGILRWQIATVLNHYKDVSSTAGVLQEVVDYIPPTQPPWPDAVEPQGIGQYGQDMSKYGILAKMVDAGIQKKATLMNLYLDTDSQVDVSSFLDANYAPTQQIKGYLDEYGALNLGDSSSIQASSVIGSVLNGQGLGLAKGGVVTNFDIRSSLAGRVLSAAGAIKDTKLGMIGAQQLALSLANNAAFNIEQQALGALNVQDNVLSLVKNGTLSGFRPNYQITVPEGTGGRLLDYTARILGFTLPKSYMNIGGSVFQSESGQIENIIRANNLILTTGKGQVTALVKNITASQNGTSPSGVDNPAYSTFRSGYAPGYTDNKGNPTIQNPSLYAFNLGAGQMFDLLCSSDNIIPDLSYKRSEKMANDGFVSPDELYLEDYWSSNIKKPTFSWVVSSGNSVNATTNGTALNTGGKKSLLEKTQKLFSSNGMLNIVSTKGDIQSKYPSQISTTNGLGTSKGSAVISKSHFLPDGRYDGEADTADNTYCRSWTTFDRYDQVSKLVRNSGLDEKVPFRSHFNNSVLDDNGFPMIAPYTTATDPKRFMLSIENLAWCDKTAELAECELGPGDLLTGKRGRIMWFPPYGINFNETSNVNWESSNFIGRGEPVYTYSNTERSGTLSFQIIVDHPTYVNSFRGPDGPDDNYVASFFAGCLPTDSYFTDKLVSVVDINEIDTNNLTNPQQIVDTPQEPPTKDKYRVYYPNDIYTYDSTYEDGICNGVPIDYSVNENGTGCTVSRAGQITSNTNWVDRYDYGLNAGTIKVGGLGPIFEINGVATPFSGFNDTNFLSALDTYLNEKCPNCVVKVKGLASQQGKVAANEELALKRAQAMIDFLKTEIHSNNKQYHDKLFPKPTSEVSTATGCPVGDGQQTDLIDCKLDRRVEISFEYDATVIPKKENAAKPVAKTDTTKKRVTTKITNKFYNECSYFDKLNGTDSFVFDKFRDKIKYFHPAFHSTTPEGLNSRLTFLHQCTRQGPTLEKQGAHNLAFGRSPVCILRIGDFYNTKVIFDNLTIDYEPIVWDLNPEGIGVQPMIANVTLSFKFLGGSSLMGPINKLQNALSFNYYANAHVYDPRADYIAKDANSASFIQIATDFDSYSIQNDFDTIYNRKMTAIKEVTTQDVANNTPVDDQIANNDKTNSGEAPKEAPPSAPVDDFEKVSLTNVENIANGAKLVFSIKNSPLSKDQDVRVQILRGAEGAKEIGVGKITTTGGETQELSFTGFVSTLVSGQTYTIIAVFNGDTAKRRTIPFTYNP